MKIQIVRQIARSDMKFEVSSESTETDVNVLTVSLFFLPVIISVIDSLVRSM